MKTELSEVLERNKAHAANKSFDKRLEEIEKQMVCLWNAPGGPGYETAMLAELLAAEPDYNSSVGNSGSNTMFFVLDPNSIPPFNMPNSSPFILAVIFDESFEVALKGGYRSEDDNTSDGSEANLKRRGRRILARGMRELAELRERKDALGIQKSYDNRLDVPEDQML
ncbi:hypothetical protein HDU87_006503 [Geranomyces variabilis]|uniref:Uncharacterized protein n=1 Tax=Geranomyces variabilis TaxID=109894 RepID=A0AAD5TKT7_9FUNG|nr:hypothetical protein HDU87_006503 [Geranomyces variabilis]